MAKADARGAPGSEPLAITLDQLRVFVAVVEEGSFGRAAKKLRRVQSAISYSIANFERLLDVTLFDRTGRSPVLTPAGEVLLPEARAALERVDRFTARARMIAAGTEPTLSLAVDELFPMPALLAVLDELRCRFPDVDLGLRTEALGAVTALVEDGQCQIGVGVEDAPGNHAIEASVLTTVDLVPMCAPSHRLATLRRRIDPTELKDELQIVVTDRSERTRGVDHGVLSDRTWRVASLDAKRALLAAGHGWGTLPAHLVPVDGSLVVIDIDREPVRVTLNALTRVADPPGVAGRWLLEALRRTLAGPPRESRVD
ncbi:MAG: LysR family transcriptional regulator [Sandaracinaceae bacterium]